MRRAARGVIKLSQGGRWSSWAGRSGSGSRRSWSRCEEEELEWEEWEWEEEWVWAWACINKEVRALDTRVHENIN